ncbi:MAG: DUF748 domain-containing protein, partial [Burkholderiales bacterium]|nr:DUF748 domain-containing protein [Burkholderiales bacterium]
MKLKRAALAACAVLALVIVAAWAGVPPLLRWQAQTRLAAGLGRSVSVGEVDFHPWSLTLTVHDLAIAAAPGAPAGTAPLLQVARLRAELAFWPLFAGLPVIETLEIDAPRIALTRLAAGRYDIDDVIRRLGPGRGAPGGEPLRFALYDLQLRDGQLRLDDRPAGRVQQVKGLRLSLPFLSNRPQQADRPVAPRLAFELNGTPFDSAAVATPFAADDRGHLELAWTDLDLAPYLPYLPAGLPVRLLQGRLSADLKLAFEAPRQGPPRLALSGWIAARDVALADLRGAPLLAWRHARLGLRDVQPLARRLAFGSL